MPKRRLVSPTGKPVVLKPVRPNVAVEAKFHKRLVALINEMAASFDYWISAQWRAKPPEMAADSWREEQPGSPAKGLIAEIASLGSHWEARFAAMAPKLATWFTTSMATRSDAVLKSILKEGGWTVEFKLSRPVNDVLQASIGAQVDLIKSIPQQYLTQVQGIVMRGVQTGYDLHQITEGLKTQLGVAHNRAAFIARDQANKATATITRARQLEMGVTQAVWMHSGGGRQPRPSHVKAGREKLVYDVAKGAFIDGEYIWPGMLPNCRCVSKPVIKGF
jgi:uncharacterized protein with gpF-like domain